MADVDFIQQMKDCMKARGYDLSYFTADHSVYNFAKQSVGDWINATVDTKDRTIMLSAVIGLFTISSGALQFDHPRFSMFENKLAVMQAKVLY